jgi:hypothetical protein
MTVARTIETANGRKPASPEDAGIIDSHSMQPVRIKYPTLFGRSVFRQALGLNQSL